MTDPEISEYLRRINLDACEANLNGLMQLQAQHMEYIPFENLDIVVGRKISLDHASLFQKIIGNNRGGYCFELNTLYSELLQALGFSVVPVLGRVWLSNPKNLPPRNHLALLVSIDEKTYLTDVGFGGLISSVPLDIDSSETVNDKDGLVRISRLDDYQFMIQRHNEKEWTNLYSFENLPISGEDIAISNHYMSTHTDSHFYYHKFAGRSTKEGRIGLFNNKMSIRKGIKAAGKKRIEYGDDWIDALHKEFSLTLDFSEKELDLLLEKTTR